MKQTIGHQRLDINLSNKKQTEIKRLIIESIQELVDKRIIKPSFKIIQKDGSLIVQNNFTSKLITKSKIIYLEEILYYKNSLNQLKSNGVKLSFSNGKQNLKIQRNL